MDGKTGLTIARFYASCVLLALAFTPLAHAKEYKPGPVAIVNTILCDTDDQLMHIVATMMEYSYFAGMAELRVLAHTPNEHNEPTCSLLNVPVEVMAAPSTITIDELPGPYDTFYPAWITPVVYERPDGTAAQGYTLFDGPVRVPVKTDDPA